MDYLYPDMPSNPEARPLTEKERLRSGFTQARPLTEKEKLRSVFTQARPLTEKERLRSGFSQARPLRTKPRQGRLQVQATSNDVSTSSSSSHLPPLSSSSDDALDVPISDFLGRPKGPPIPSPNPFKPSPESTPSLSSHPNTEDEFHITAPSLYQGEEEEAPRSDMSELGETAFLNLLVIDF